jgi:hypothetical protein
MTLPPIETHDSEARLRRRTMLAGATGLAAAGTTLFGGLSPAAALVRQDGPGVLDLSRPPGKAGRRVLQLSFDTSAGKQDAVPLQLVAADGRKLEATVTSTTGRTAVAGTKRAAQAAARRAARESTREADRSARVTVSGKKSTTVWVAPTAVGDPGEPGDRLTVRTPDGDRQVEAWIAPARGQWRQGKELGIVAMHAAMMNSPEGAKVVMWSLPRLTDDQGRPLKDPQREGQWQWYKFQLNDCESRTWTVNTGDVKDTPLPKILPGTWEHPKTPRRDNLFCAGAAHLPDGRLLVVAGHMGTFYTQCDNGGLHDNANHLYVFDPTRHSWSKVEGADLRPYVRWYPTVTTLPDGRMLITSGSRELPEGASEYPNALSYWDNINDNYVLYDPKKDTVSTSYGPLTDEKHLGHTVKGKRERLATYPGVFVLPKGQDAAVVAMAECNRGWLYDLDPNRTSSSPLRLGGFYRMKGPGSRSYPTYGSMVLLPLEPHRPGATARILVVGGQGGNRPDHRSLDPGQPTTDTAEILDVDTARPLNEQQPWRAPKGGRPRMRNKRFLCGTTLLADGTVLVSGGAQTGWGDQNRKPVYAAEIFDPRTESFLPAADAETDRRYHSVELLQLDGTVLKAGSTGGFGNVRAPGTSPENPCGPTKYKGRFDTDKDTGPGGDGKPWMKTHTDAEIFHPPYMWRPRPAIKTAPDQLYYDRPFILTATGEAIDDRPDRTGVAVIRLGSATHGNDMDQRYVRLKVARREKTDEGWRLTTTSLTNPAAAPPGDYQLVVIDASGVPSQGRMVRITHP